MFARTFSFWRRLVGRDGSPQPGSDPGDTERRVWIRYPANLEATFQPAGATNRFPARVRDISRGGANLIAGQPLKPGDLLSLELPDAAGQVQNVLACIVRITDHGPAEWALGCIFSRELSDDDLQGFGARRQKHTPADQRTWIRFPCEVGASYEVVGTNAPPQDAEVLNISANGVGLLVSESIEAGTLLTVELHSGAGPTVRTILACVVRVSGHGPDRWALGCNFIHELSEEDLQVLAAKPIPHAV
jgi:hypothetical protein